MATFLVSGFVHEYILIFLVQRKGETSSYEPQFGNQFLFFAWNGIVLFLERALLSTEQGQSSSKWMQSNVPKPIRTALVLLTVLPIAHLFTDEYVKSSFYDDAAFGFPRIEYLGKAISP